jgi:hypothetical protein
VVRGSPHPASGHVDSLASLLIRPAAFADSKFLSPFPKRLKSPQSGEGYFARFFDYCCLKQDIFQRNRSKAAVFAILSNRFVLKSLRVVPKAQCFVSPLQ